MSHFAKIDENNVVTQVIVAEQDFINSGAVGASSNWVQTSYNTKGGVHNDGGVALRKNYAGIGYTYDKDRDAFIPPQPFPSWIWNIEQGYWEAPVECPEITKTTLQRWNEETISWDEVVIE